MAWLWDDKMMEWQISNSGVYSVLSTILNNSWSASKLSSLMNTLSKARKPERSLQPV